MRRCRVYFIMVALALTTNLANVMAQGLPYPNRTPFQIKGAGVGPFDTLPRVEIWGNEAGSVAFNLWWNGLEPIHKPAPCSGDEFVYDGYCFKIYPEIDAYIQEYTAHNVNVTGILAFVPNWAGVPCINPELGPAFCAVAPTHMADYGRFAAAMAWRYNGLNGHGRVVNFVIHNEVNAYIWYDIGCGGGEGIPCDVNAWVASYAASYNAAYDRIKTEQAAAKVLVSQDFRFFGPDVEGHQTAKSFLLNFASRVGSRQWSLAFHAGIPSAEPAFGVDIGYPYATPGSIGHVAGWLRQNFPSTPSAWEIQLTENGIPTPNRPSGPSEQAMWLCSAFNNFLGTPGITSYIYTPITTWPTFGTQELVTCQPNSAVDPICNPNTFSPKPSWGTWAVSNRAGALNCGFEVLPYVRLTRYYNPARGHWVSTRIPPAGFHAEGFWRILREPEAGTHLLYECHAPGNGTSHSLVSTASHCEGLEALGPLGYAYDGPAAGRVALYRCSGTAGPGTHFVSTDPNCEGAISNGLIGYAVP